MNCKPGDLAILLKSYAGNEGKIFRCIRLMPGVQGLTRPDGVREKGAVWELDHKVRTHDGTLGNWALDCDLRPIRDPGDDAVDETLLRLPSPRQEVTA